MAEGRKPIFHWRPSSVFRSTFFLAAEHVLNLIAGIGISVILIRLLTVEEFGLFQLAHSLAAFSIYFFNFGFSRITLKAVPEEIAGNNSRGAVRLHLLLSLLRGLAVLGLLILTLAFGDDFAALVNAAPLFGAFALPVISYVLLTNFHDYFSRTWLTAVMRRDLVSIGIVLRRMGLFAWVVGMSVDGASIQLALWGLVATLAVEVVFLGTISLLTVRSLLARQKTTERALPLRQLLSFGLQAWVWEILQFCRDPAAMTLLMSSLRGPDFVALQHAARLIPDALRNLSPGKAGFGILLPKIASRAALESSPETLRFVFMFLTKLNLIVWGGLLLLLAVNFDVIFPLVFGELYADQWIAGLLFAAAALIAILIDPYYLAANAVHEGRILIGAGIVGVAIVPLAYLLIPYWGIEGAAAAGIISGLALLLFFSLSFSARGYRFLRFPLGLAVLCCLRLTVIPTCFYASAYLMGTAGMNDGYLLRALASLLSALAFIGVLRLSSPFNAEEIAALRDRLPFPGRRSRGDSA